MPKFNTIETCSALAILGGVAGWLVFSDPQNTLLSLIVGGLLGALNLSPQKGTTP
jgi:hypothetical protein